ncbi:helix-turn-helix domain-containing protein [Actinomadura sp. WMMB 499]|uniref:helix-turn-helix domain-containing protein n=1 Tax=Actinomadura sp. WMMB 499 TaxID=1219491 RepID=UPI0012446A2A|nr:helix-turn-helix domain-containing protein [Actinomadura sp. WMMB 499]QFG23675.1 PucR family transcriptional regulator [Actinomadura sp. WMMB 499]
MALDVSTFEKVPKEITEWLRARVDRAAGELLRELGERGAAPAAGDEGRRVRSGVAAGLRHFCDLVDDPDAGWDRVRAFYLRVGRHLARDGRDPDEIGQALRRSALAAWRTLAAVPGGLDLDRAALGLVVDAQFAYMDAVAEVIAAGYREERAAGTDLDVRRRSRLLHLLLADPPADPDLVAALAREARWPRPRTVAAAAARPRRDGAVPPRTPPPGALADFGAAEPALLFPDAPGGARPVLPDDLLRDWVVAIGPAVPLARAARSLRWARETLALAGRGGIPDSGPIRSAEHVPALVISRAGELIDDAAATRLAPLRTVPPARRDRLTETLLALLEHNFNAADAGRRLRVHPQTVRYRLRHLQLLFGDDLRDPRRCLELELILRRTLSTD